MSVQGVSADGEAVLLLCGRFGGERQEAFQPLSMRDWAVFAPWLNQRGMRPADLLSAAAHAQLDGVQEIELERPRIEFLLARGTAMALALERWSRAGLWVISRADAAYPGALKRRLKHAAPPLLYGAGRPELLDLGGLAIVGSRDAGEAALEFARQTAATCADEGMVVLSSGAHGVEMAAMQSALEAGGQAVGVLPGDLLKASLGRLNRGGLQQGRLTLVSPCAPQAGFDDGQAMAHNKYLCALADRTVVIDAEGLRDHFERDT
jgi:predicted Rossmann fold nucleotide-binding protein DprA/Smf involved in DNA uptake